ncbi:MAG: hypothetical protein R3B07_17575 [Polyangiaceae bacterium]
MAHAKGASPWRVCGARAAGRVDADFVVVAAQLGALLGGAVVLERLFERPGLGSLMLNAYAARDIPVLEASVVAAGLLFGHRTVRCRLASKPSGSAGKNVKRRRPLEFLPLALLVVCVSGIVFGVGGEPARLHLSQSWSAPSSEHWLGFGDAGSTWGSWPPMRPFARWC